MKGWFNIWKYNSLVVQGLELGTFTVVAQVPCLVRELRSHSHVVWQKKKKKKKNPESSEVYLYMNSQLIFNKSANTTQENNVLFSNQWCWDNWTVTNR